MIRACNTCDEMKPEACKFCERVKIIHHHYAEAWQAVGWTFARLTAEGDFVMVFDNALEEQDEKPTALQAE